MCLKGPTPPHRRPCIARSVHKNCQTKASNVFTHHLQLQYPSRRCSYPCRKEHFPFAACTHLMHPVQEPHFLNHKFWHGE